MTGKIVILSSQKELKFNKVTISIIKDDDDLVPKGINLYCLANNEQIEFLSKHFKIQNTKTNEEVLIFSLKDNILSENMLKIANSKDINTLMEIGDLDLLNLDNYEYTGLSLSK